MVKPRCTNKAEQKGIGHSMEGMMKERFLPWALEGVGVGGTSGSLNLWPVSLVHLQGTSAYLSSSGAVQGG